LLGAARLVPSGPPPRTAASHLAEDGQVVELGSFVCREFESQPDPT